MDRFTAWVIQHRINLRRRQIDWAQKEMVKENDRGRQIMLIKYSLQLIDQVNELEARRAEILSR